MALVRTTRQSWVAVWAVLGLVVALLAVGSPRPAGAVAGTADAEAVYSACAGRALESRGLTDVEGSFAEDAVNCLAHYGVTTGRTATTYDPGSPVQRWQMALFLTRATGPAGLPLEANPPGGFTDLAGRSEEVVSAVNQMAALGIMPGPTGSTFNPTGLVSRADMAFMLDAFLSKATLGAGALNNYAAGEKLSDVSPDDNVFNDIDNVTRGQYSAIRRMFEAGVAKGTSDDQFSPKGLVTRAQMAVFITRMLAHTVARPAGVTLQAAQSSITTEDSVELAVSVRDSNLVAVPDAVVDIFQAVDADEAFGADGRCVTDAVSVTDGSRLCEIATGDEVTDPSGDYLTEVSLGDDSVTIWAWTGDIGDRYDTDDEDALTSPPIEVTITKPGVALKITDDMPANATLMKYGESVTFTAQVVDEDGASVKLKDVSFSAAVTQTIASGATDASPSSSSSSNSYKTDEEGMVELTFTQSDPRSGSNTRGDVSRLDLDITNLKDPDGGAFKLEDKTTLENAGVDGAEEADAAAVWKDVVAKPSILKLTQPVEYHEASTDASSTVVATLTDQYGDPVNRQRIDFTSDDTDGIGAAGDDGLVFSSASEAVRMFTGAQRLTRTTNRRGVASLTYQRDSSADGIETIMAVARLGTSDTGDDVTADRVYHYWAVEPGIGDGAEGRILKADTENNRLVLGGNMRISLIKYDSNDQLNLTSGGAPLTDFEKDLKASDTMAKYATVTNYQTATKNVTRIVAQVDPLQAVAAYPAAEFNPGSASAYYNRLTGDPAMLRSTAVEAQHGIVFAAGGGVLLVGAPGEDRVQEDGVTAADNAGAVYIYEGGDYDDPSVMLADPTPRTGDMLGRSVVVSDDGNTIMASFGALTYLRQKDAGQTWEALPNGAHPISAAGSSTDRVDDNIRSTNVLPFAQPEQPSNQNDLSGDDFTRQAVGLRGFGASQAISGDATTLVIGAPDDLGSATLAGDGSGYVYVYVPDPGRKWGGTNAMQNPAPPTPSGPGWVKQQGGVTVPNSLWGGTPATDDVANVSTLTPNEVGVMGGTNTRDNFGGHGAIAVNKTGSVVAVGVPETNAGAEGAEGFKDNVGAVYVWVQTATRSDGVVSWRANADNQTSTVKLSLGDAAVAGELLGAAIDISDDGTVIVATAPGSGKVYVFEASGGVSGWSGTISPKVLTNAAGSQYTSADLAGVPSRNIALKGDGSEIVVGNSGRAEGDWRGSVAVYTRPSDGWANTDAPTTEWLGASPNQRLGWQIAYDQSNGDIYASGYKPTYGDMIDPGADGDPATTDDNGETTRVIESTEYTIYRIDRSN